MSARATHRMEVENQLSQCSNGKSTENCLSFTRRYGLKIPAHFKPLMLLCDFLSKFSKPQSTYFQHRILPFDPPLHVRVLSGAGVFSDFRSTRYPARTSPGPDHLPRPVPGARPQRRSGLACFFHHASRIKYPPPPGDQVNFSKELSSFHSPDRHARALMLVLFG